MLESVRKLRERLLSRKFFTANEELAYKNMINCNNITELRNIKNYSYKVRCKRGKQLGIYNQIWEG
jgi:hypothetical protein